MLDLTNVHKIYFIGIGGIAMSAAANLAAKAGFEVAGSDSKEVYAPAKDVLDDYNIEYGIGYSADNIKHHPSDIYIVSAGEDEKNPEVKYVMENNFERYSFSELMYELYKEKLRVVVAGTHGKSTTSGLLGHLFKGLDDSSYMVGGVLQNENSNFYAGTGHYVVFEGDEYKSQFDDPTPKFHYYKPDILVLTNLEYDHPDMFVSLEELEDEFRQLIAAMPEDGLIVYNADNAALTKLVHESNISTVSFAIDNEADYKVEEIKYDGDFTTMDVRNKYTKQVSAHLLGVTEQYKTQLPGKINVYNALAAIATLRVLGFSHEQIALDLLSFRGIKRRFELVGRKNGVTLVDDYAHHPTEVKETLDAARLRYFGVGPSSPGEEKMPEGQMRSKGRLWAIFEPHTFSRTKATLPELAKAFESADEVLISEIYPAREKASDATITSAEAVQAISDGLSSSPLRAGGWREEDASSASERQMRSKPQVRLVHNKQGALDIIKNEAKQGDVVIVMAVGSFNRLAYELKDIL